jgi:hypothetical protein
MEHETEFDEYYNKIRDWFDKYEYEFDTIESIKAAIQDEICEILDIESENDTSKAAIEKFIADIYSVKKELEPDTFARRICNVSLRELGCDDVEYCDCDLPCNECLHAIAESMKIDKLCKEFEIQKAESEKTKLEKTCLKCDDVKLQQINSEKERLIELEKRLVEENRRISKVSFSGTRLLSKEEIEREQSRMLEFERRERELMIAKRSCLEKEKAKAMRWYKWS